MTYKQAYEQFMSDLTYLKAGFERFLEEHKLEPKDVDRHGIPTYHTANGAIHPYWRGLVQESAQSLPLVVEMDVDTFAVKMKMPKPQGDASTWGTCKFDWTSIRFIHKECKKLYPKSEKEFSKPVHVTPIRYTGKARPEHLWKSNLKQADNLFNTFGEWAKYFRNITEDCGDLSRTIDYHLPAQGMSKTASSGALKLSEVASEAKDKAQDHADYWAMQDVAWENWRDEHLNLTGTGLKPVSRTIDQANRGYTYYRRAKAAFDQIPVDLLMGRLCFMMKDSHRHQPLAETYGWKLRNPKDRTWEQEWEYPATLNDMWDSLVEDQNILRANLNRWRLPSVEMTREMTDLLAYLYPTRMEAMVGSIYAERHNMGWVQQRLKEIFRK